jgi:hypothetical protein
MAILSFAPSSQSKPLIEVGFTYSFRADITKSDLNSRTCHQDSPAWLTSSIMNCHKEGAEENPRQKGSWVGTIRFSFRFSKNEYPPITLPALRLEKTRSLIPDFLVP